MLRTNTWYMFMCKLGRSKSTATALTRRNVSGDIHGISHTRVVKTAARASLYTCSINAEPLERYRYGGYHPVQLGDFLRNGRYRILHKLGWGGYSTIWAARDQRLDENVALKISVAERQSTPRELSALATIAEWEPDYPGMNHILPLIDNFQIDGPNGKHECLVLDIVGPKVPDVVEHMYRDNRLPGNIAKRVAKQALLALNCLHRHGIAHGDLHIGNLAFSIPSSRSLPENELLRRLASPDIAPVQRREGEPREQCVPEYLVRPTSLLLEFALQSASIKLIDFGEAYFEHDPPSRLHTPLVVRPPEAIFNDKLSTRSDMWSMGCALFELFTGQPPFDSILITPPLLVRQMLDTTGEDLPERWKAAWQAMDPPLADDEDCSSLQEWLEEIYFDGDLKPDLSHDDIRELGRLMKLMLRLEPAARASAQEIIHAPWFRDV